MSSELMVLVVTAASIGFFHTLLGPDHYLPFIMMSQSGRWSLRKTSLVTVLCGLGHVLSSVLLGVLGVSVGIAISKLESVESFRGGLAAWALIAFGLIYFVWGLRKALRHKIHGHSHLHKDSSYHIHDHNHTKEHMHVHAGKSTKSITPWVLFTIFVLGPCEPLIPILLYPAAKSSLAGLLLVSGVFGGVTIVTMLSVVLVSTFGINLVPSSKLERYSHAIAGATICLCGVSIQFLGL